MACNSNAAAAIASWLSSTNSPHQTMRAHMEKELLRMISHKRHLVATIAQRDAHCIERQSILYLVWKSEKCPRSSRRMFQV